MAAMGRAALLLLLATVVHSFYDGDDGVVSLTPANLKQHIKPNTIWCVLRERCVPRNRPLARR